MQIEEPNLKTDSDLISRANQDTANILIKEVTIDV